MAVLLLATCRCTQLETVDDDSDAIECFTSRPSRRRLLHRLTLQQIQ